MKPTIAALWRDRHGLCIEHSNMRDTRQNSSPSVRTMSQKFKAESVKNGVALNVQEISNGLPLLSMTGKFRR
jgi:hypothetical protein